MRTAGPVITKSISFKFSRSGYRLGLGEMTDLGPGAEDEKGAIKPRVASMTASDPIAGVKRRQARS
jgi:hypothetical protein